MKLAVLYAGQGAQHPGMGKEFYEASSAFRGKAMAEAAKGLACGMTAVLGLDREKLSACCEQAAEACLLYTSPSPRDRTRSRMPSSA